MADSIKTKSVFITNEIFSGVQDGKKYATIERNSIEAIYLKHGVASKHPIAQFVIGLSLVGFGFYPIIGVFRMLSDGGFVPSNSFIAALLSLPIGCLIIYDLIRKQYFFEVIHKNGREIIVLTGSSHEEILKVKDAACEKFRYSIIHQSK